MTDTDNIVALVVSPGYHGQTEHRVALMDNPGPNAEFENLYPYLSSNKWFATRDRAREVAGEISATNSYPIKEYHFTESYYQVRKRMNRADT